MLLISSSPIWSNIIIEQVDLSVECLDYFHNLVLLGLPAKRQHVLDLAILCLILQDPMMYILFADTRRQLNKFQNC
jgi:hypothetical protein